MYINNVKFAKNEQNCSGKIELEDHPRLQETDVIRGTVDFALRGYVDKLNRPAIELKICGIIHTSCQNCLKPIDIKIDNQSQITIFYTEEELDAALFGDSDLGVEDGVLAKEEFDVLDLVEDEIIMLIPYAIKHESCLGLNYKDDTANHFTILKDINKGN